MNKAAKLFVAGIALLIGVTGAQAQVYFSIDFSAAEGYVDGNIIGQPSGGSDVWIDGNPDSPEEGAVIENGALKITHDAAGHWLYIPIPVQQGVFTVTWDWQYFGPADGMVDIGVCLSDSVNFELVDGNPVPNWNEQGAMIRMQADAGMIDVRDGDWDGGGSYLALEEYSYQDGALNHIRLEIDAAAWTFDAYAQPEGGSEVKLAEGYGFRRLPSEETNGLNCILIWDNGADTRAENGSIIDNIVIFGETAVSDWDLF